MFAALGVPVIDTDVIARQLVEPGQPALKEITQFFGPQVIAESGQLDRRAMRDIIFSDPNLRLELEAILHPRIRTAVREQVESINAPYCLVVIPLLLETGQQKMVDRILVVDASPELQIQRTTLRDETSESAVKAILAEQVERDERLAAADDVIHNEGELATLEQQVQVLHEHYLSLAKNR
jgi:dephospho-CoA kinase